MSGNFKIINKKYKKGEKMALRTDLVADISIPETEKKGIKQSQKKIDEVTISKTKIITDTAAKIIGKEKGKYITLEFDEIDKISDLEPLKKALRESLESLINSTGESIFVIGLGNRDITCDNIGPNTVSKLLATRHIKSAFEKISGLENLRSVAVLAPDVMGKTGLEVKEIAESVVSKIKPGAVIVIDALMSCVSSRIFRTIQLCNTGISPGSGVKNQREELSEKTLSVPVIAIGVPTVVSANALAFELTGSEPETENEMIVTPTNADILSKKICDLLSSVLNEFLQPETDPKILEALV